MVILIVDEKDKIKGTVFNLRLINECLEAEYIHINSNLVANQPFASYGEFIGNRPHDTSRLFIANTHSINGGLSNIREYKHEETREGIEKASELIKTFRKSKSYYG